VIVAQKPKLAPYFKEMKKNIASVLGVETGRINIKATTTEKLGFAGREEGVVAYAVALLVKND
jgi:2-C-methyl-D-erythritol 2,4-cyclodiphosphate synthase